MSAKYSRLPTDETSASESSVIDFSSYFTYADPLTQHHPKYFSYVPKRGKLDYGPNAWSAVQTNVEYPGILGRCCATLITFFCYLLVFLTFPISVWFTLKTVQEFERVVIYRLGMRLATKKPGKMLILPCLDRYTRVDIRPRAFSVPPFMVLLTDGAAVELGAEVYFAIRDPVLSVSGVRDLNYSVRILAQTTLTRRLSQQQLHDITSDRSTIIDKILGELNEAVTPWGLEITKIELSKVKVLQESNPMMAAFQGGGNPLNNLGSVLFPPGMPDNLPMKLLQTVQMGMQMSQTAPDGMPVAQPSSPPALAPAVPVQVPTQAQLSQMTELIKKPFTPSDLVTLVRPHLNEYLVQQYRTVYKFVVAHEDKEEVYHLDLKNGFGTAGEGEPPGGEADVVITIGSGDLGGLLQGELSAFNAYMSGRLSIEGDVRSAMSLQDLMEKIKS